MKILINAFSARQGGGQTYLINLLQAVPPERRADIGLLLPDGFALPGNCAGFVRLPTPRRMENPFLRAAWERIALPRLLRRLDVRVLFCPGGVVGTRPPSGCRVVTMFRNMIPFDREQRRRYPLGYMRVRNWLLERVMLRSMLRADLVIFISEFARQVIESAAGRPLAHAVVIPHGVNEAFRRRSIIPPRPAWLPREEYFLYVSTLDVYKAQVQVVQGFAKYRALVGNRHKLVLIGPENPRYGRRVRAEIARLGLQHDVIVLGKVPYDELPAAYQHAYLNIFASESENCPNILLECLAAGRPIVCSSRPPMPEFAKDAVEYFDPACPDELGALLARLARTPERCEQLAQRALRRGQDFDWSSSARKTWAAIHALV